jgi:hypothetical protein
VVVCRSSAYTRVEVSVAGGMSTAPPLWAVDCWRQRRCMSTLWHCSCASRRAADVVLAVAFITPRTRADRLRL